MYVGAVTTVSLATSAVDRGCHTLWALRREWRLVTAARGKEAAVLVFVVSLLPAVVYPVPVYSFSFVYPPERFGIGSYYDYEARSHDLWLLGVVSGSGLPSIGAQLFSMVTAHGVLLPVIVNGDQEPAGRTAHLCLSNINKI